MTADNAGLAGLLAVNAARAAARAGDLAEAARLLDELDAAGSASVAALDLLARVHAQRGNLAEADGCWARVLELHPDNADAAAGRRAVARIRAGRRLRPLWTPGRTAVAATVVTAMALVGGVGWLTTAEPAAPAEPVTAAPDPELTARAAALARRVAELAPLEAREAQRAADRARRARELAVVADALAIPGVRVERRATDVRVVFDDGVFVRSAQITGRGARLLAELGRRLAGLPVSTTVVGHVVAVPGGRTSGGSTVALARAQVAAARLAAGGGLPITAFTLVSADQTQGPFPEAARNRTVTLLVAPAT